MLTNLDFLEEGKEFPPKSESKRMDTYANNKRIFKGEHTEVYKECLKRIERVVGNFEDVVSYPVVLNFQKLITLKIGDLLLGEEPEITSNDEVKAKAINKIIENSNLHSIAEQVCYDVSRYGDGLFYIRQEDGKGIIDITQPTIWYPIVDENNIKQLKLHILAWKKQDVLTVQIHDKGFYTQRIFEVSNGGIILSEKVSMMEEVETNLSDYAIIQVPNVTTSDTIYGIDDYSDLDSIISDLMVRIGQVDRILDKHASPTMSGPTSALEQDILTGRWKLKTGNYIPRDNKDDPPVEYITWEGQLEANFRQIEKLLNFLYTISEMGSSLFGDLTNNTGQVPSGSALKRLMISPLAKVSRIRKKFDYALKKAIVLCSQLGGEDIVELQFEDISINWQDGLPSDVVEDAEVMSKRTANKATMSQMRALMLYDGMTEEEAETELARIQDEEMALDPMAIGPFAEVNQEDLLEEGELAEGEEVI